MRQAERNEAPDISLEARPEPGPLLGRVLHALGAPVGVKAQQEELSLPAYLQAVSPADRRDFARVYAINRGSHPDAAKAGYQIVTRRSSDFFEALRGFFASVTGESVSIHRSPERVYLSKAAVEALAGAGADAKAGLAYRLAYGEGNRLVSEEALANTYRGSYRNPWTIVQQYRAVQKRRAEAADPDSLSPADIAREVGGDNLRVYHWLQESGPKPYAVNGLETAVENGWLNLDVESPAFKALNKVMAWVLAAGYIDRSTMHPRFAIQTTHHRDVFDDIFSTVNTEYEEKSTVVEIRSAQQSNRSYASPRSDGAVLGRVLLVLGAPWGNLSWGLPALPTYLATAPDDIKHTYAQLIAFNRWAEPSDSGSLTISVPNESKGLQTALHLLFRDVTDGSIDSGDASITLSEPQASTLFPGVNGGEFTPASIADSLLTE